MGAQDEVGAPCISSLRQRRHHSLRHRRHRHSLHRHSLLCRRHAIVDEKAARIAITEIAAD
jgi:hypothetical protein